MIEDASWMIRWLVVDTGHWLPGRKVLLPPASLGHPDPQSREFPVKLTMQQRERVSKGLQSQEGDPHLRSIAAVTGYRIHAADGDIGYVEDFLVDEAGGNIL